MDYKKEFILTPMVIKYIFELEWQRKRQYHDHSIPIWETYQPIVHHIIKFKVVDRETGWPWYMCSELKNGSLLRYMDWDLVSALDKCSKTQ